jgi:hypothetical protein
MKLVSVDTDVSPDNPEFARITGRIRRDSGEQLEIWFEISRDLQNQLSETANPWIVAMLPYALSNGETIVSDIPADPELLENLKGLVAIWCRWHPQFVKPEIVTPVIALETATTPGTRSAAFFSGGVDSWFTVLRHTPELERAAVGRIDDLITVHGFDIPAESRDEFVTLHEALSLGAKALGRDLIVVKTNLRKSGSLWAKGWGWLTHSAGLATVALVLEKRYGKVLLASSHPYSGLFRRGSHPMTDVLFSTRSLQVKHDGASYTRVEKTALVARHKIALSHLHVCWETGSASNCGECAKCIRTMATLQLLGALEGSNPFPMKFQLEKLSGVYIENAVEAQFFREIYVLADRTGERDIQAAALRALRRSSRIRPLVELADRLSDVPIMWRFAPRMRRWCVG